MPPHFHAIYNDLEGVFELSTLDPSSCQR
ncbi:hypothetical protein [Fibrobacter succinogenes]